ncbi:hypothetical protein [Streptococcus pneumoniae]|uniref:hypothetical protein n=1 Tax=Streptococcus pneumoniae TaxID=1313 RepID=UPI000B3EECF4|nr:hypothetical protein [Streptococcus pneumoniae]
MSLFIIGHMGLFFYTKIGSIISIRDLPTTNIIEPEFPNAFQSRFRVTQGAFFDIIKRTIIS